MKKLIYFFALLFLSVQGISQTRITAPLVRNSPSDTSYYLLADSLLRGGLMVFTNTTTRDALPFANRKQGMIAVVDTFLYQLRGGITNSDWYTLDLAGGSGGAGITELIGDVTAIGPGIATATIDTSSFKLQALIKGVVKDSSLAIAAGTNVTFTGTGTDIDPLTINSLLDSSIVLSLIDANAIDSLRRVALNVQSRKGGVWTTQYTDSVGSTGVTVTSYSKNLSGDSTILLLSDGTRYAAKDSVGITTATLSDSLLNYLKLTGTDPLRPMIGDVEVAANYSTFKLFNKYGSNRRQVYFSDEDYFGLEHKDTLTGVRNAFVDVGPNNMVLSTNGELTKLEITPTTLVVTMPAISKGITSTTYFSNKDANTFSQMQDIADSMVRARAYADSVVAAATVGGGMVYPSAGIALSNGTNWVGSITNNSANWNTAFGWGDHAGLYRPIGYVPTFASITSKPTTLSGYGITDAYPLSGNPSGFLTSVPAQSWASITGKPSFATVATTGDYADLTGKPTIPAAQVNADWNSVSGVSQILNKPTIGTGDMLKSDNLSGLSNYTTARTNLGLGNVTNTSDAAKPISTLTQAGLDLKINIADSAAMLLPYASIDELEAAKVEYTFKQGLYVDGTDIKAQIVSVSDSGIATPAMKAIWDAKQDAITTGSITNSMLANTAVASLSGTNTGNQTITNTSNATSHTATLSASGGSIQFVEGSNITLTTTGTGSAAIVTIASTGGGGGGGQTFKQSLATSALRLF